MTRPVRAGVLMVALVVAAACGQKPTATDGGAAGPPVEQPAGFDAGPPPDPGPAAPPAETDDPGPDPAAAPETPAQDARATPRAGTGAPASPAPARSGPAPRPAGESPAGQAAAPPPAPGTAPAPGPAAPARPVDRTGVTDQMIRIGVHAPVTGAAPLPQASFDRGKDIYWKFLAEHGGVHGRNAEIIFRDDQFNPSRAVQVCRELVEQDKVFVLFGAAGSEQITACARYADSVGVPYLSAGVNEDGLTGLANYFAVSHTYAQQSPMLASLVTNRLGKTKLAIVMNNTPALNETLRTVVAAAQDAGLQIVRTSRIGKNASDAELLSEANSLRGSGAEVVYLLTSPVNFIKLATNAQAQAYRPVYIGPGLTNGLNLVAEAGCPAIDGSQFLSPFPQLDVIDRLDPNYRAAYARYAGGDADDVGLAQWGLNKVIHQMLEATGRDLSRQSLLATLTSGREFVSNVYPAVSYSGTIRFGSRSMHLLEADCSARQFKTAATFATGF